MHRPTELDRSLSNLECSLFPLLSAWLISIHPFFEFKLINAIISSSSYCYHCYSGGCVTWAGIWTRAQMMALCGRFSLSAFMWVLGIEQPQGLPLIWPPQKSERDPPFPYQKITSAHRSLSLRLGPQNYWWNEFPQYSLLPVWPPHPSNHSHGWKAPFLVHV